MVSKWNSNAIGWDSNGIFQEQLVTTLTRYVIEASLYRSISERSQKQTNVPNIRLAYRHQALVEELAILKTNNTVQSLGAHTSILPSNDAVATGAIDEDVKI